LKLNFRFVGSPGTGKTTVARRMGEMFCHLGVIARPDVVECSASDLIGEYVGQTGPKTQRKIQEALGGVLFIDEAYRLNPTTSGTFAKEALDELVDILTKPDVVNKLVVILAGYANDIDVLMSANSGLASRFTERILFDDFSAADCVTLLEMKLRQAEWELPNGLRSKVEPLFQKLIRTRGWGNGRDVDTLSKAINRAAAFEADQDEDVEDTQLSTDVIVRELRKMLEEKSLLKGNVIAAPSTLPQATRKPTSSAPPCVTTTDAIQETQPRKNNTSVESNGLPGRDDGVSDVIWEQLKKAWERDQQREDEARRAQEKAEAAERKLKEAQERARREKEEKRRRELEQLRKEAEERAQRAREEAEKQRREREREETIQRKLRNMGKTGQLCRRISLDQMWLWLQVCWRIPLRE